MNKFMIHIVAKDQLGICHDLVFFDESIDKIKARIYEQGFTEKDIEGTYEIRCLSGEDISLPYRIGGY